MVTIDVMAADATATKALLDLKKKFSRKTFNAVTAKVLGEQNQRKYQTYYNE